MYTDKSAAAPSKAKAVKLIMDMRDFYDYSPELHKDITTLEDSIMKKFNISDKDLTEHSMQKTAAKKEDKKESKKKSESKKEEKSAPNKENKSPEKSAPKKDEKKSPEKNDDKENLTNRARQLLMKHPELANNARGLFRNENGKTIVEETVPRGDLSKENLIYPRCQGDLEEDDLRGLAVYASTLIDKTLAGYDEKVAQEDALTKAIWNKDGGKYANRVNQSTFQLIMDQMVKIKKASTY
jgi:hypothetical protein